MNKYDQCLVCATRNSQCPRCQAYERLPKWAWLQAFITWVMGVPHAGQKPYFSGHSPLRAARSIFIVLALSVMSSATLVQAIPHAGLPMMPPILLLLLASLMVTSGMLRAMSIYLEHYASHGAFGRFNNEIGELAAMIGFAVPLAVYADAHKIHHPQVATEDDPDQEVIERIGFRPGQSVPEYWRILWLALLPGPQFLRDLRIRWQSNFNSAQPLKRKLMLIGILSSPAMVAITLSLTSNSLMPLIAWGIAWLLPLTYGLWVSKVLFAIGLHVYFYQPDPRLSARENYQKKTGARFFGDDVPKRDLPLQQRYAGLLVWFVRFTFVHLLAGKLFVMGLSDNQLHDAHHVNGRDFRFWLAPYSRHELAQSGRYGMWHTWGSVLTAIKTNFEYWSRLKG